ncbi:hypothetical protein ACFLZP_04475 [Patescibacteria group bacterium]
MAISLPALNKLNVLEVQMLKKILGISYDQRKGIFQATGSFSTKKLLEIYQCIKNMIWTQKNIQRTINELEQASSKRTRVHYFGNGKPIALDGFISKMGLLEHDILVEDPLCFPITVKPEFKGHILKEPKPYIKHIFENAVALVYLEEWVKKGYVYFIPSLPLIDIKAFWDLADINKKLADIHNFKQQPGTIKAMRYSIAESTIRVMLEMSRLMQDNYETGHIKRAFPEVSDEEAEKYLEILKNQSPEEREQSVIRWALNKQKLTDEESLSLLSYYEKSRPFQIERFLDTSKIKGGLMANSGMPLLQVTYLSERFNCIPATDNLGLMYGYEGWCQALDESFDPAFESVRSKVELPFSFLDNIPLPFIEKARESGKGRLASQYLDSLWKAIRDSHTVETYQKSSVDFATKVTSEYDQLKKDNSLLMDDLCDDITKAGFTWLGTFVSFNLVTEMPLAIVGSLAATIATSIGSVKSIRRGKNELQVRPLAIFFKAEKEIKKIS